MQVKEQTVRTRHGKMDWLQIGKGVHQGCVFSLVQFSHSFVSDSLWPHGLQHARPPCPSPTPEFTQTHVHWVGDAIQPSHPPSSPSPLAFNLSQHQSLFQWISSSHQVAKGVHQSCVLSPCLFNLYAEYIMQNAGLDEAQAGIKIARRNINNLR